MMHSQPQYGQPAIFIWTWPLDSLSTGCKKFLKLDYADMTLHSMDAFSCLLSFAQCYSMIKAEMCTMQRVCIYFSAKCVSAHEEEQQ